VVYCGALHQHDTADAAEIVRNLAESLHPGGRLFVIDLLSGSAFSSLFGLNMALVSPQSRIHSPDEVLGYLSRCGLKQLAVSAAGEDQGLYTIVSGVA
jgi:hypothetical protein